MPIPPAAFCALNTPRGDKLFLLVDVTSYPQLSEAVLLLGKTFFTGKNRAQRYVTLFKAYECLENNPDVMLSAVRHGLSHAPSALSRPKTVAALRELFGTTSIDLSIAAHRRIFYFQLVKLLIAVDSILTSALIDVLPNLRKVASEDIPLNERQVKGWAGIYPSMRVNTEAVP